MLSDVRASEKEMKLKRDGEGRERKKKKLVREKRGQASRLKHEMRDWRGTNKGRLKPSLNRPTT